MDNYIRIKKRDVLKLAGAFVAWVIGSGFATGQEILQFFTSYGYLSYGVVLINFLGFIIIGRRLMILGYEHREETDFNHFKYFCGEKLGSFYSYLIPITIVMIMPVLIAGSGATFFEFFGINRYAGSLIMSALVLTAYLIGFEKLVKVVSMIGPVIIVFSLVVGLVTVFSDFSQFHFINEYRVYLYKKQTSFNWVLSGVLYLSLNFLSGSTYFVQLGKIAHNRKEASLGAVIGAAALIGAILIMNTAIILNADKTTGVAIPMLYLAKKISMALGGFFSVVLLMGMFSSCSAMMWSVCSKFEKYGKKKNLIYALGILAVTFFLGLLPFGKLVGILYPLVGYIGLVFVFLVIYRSVIKRIN